MKKLFALFSLTAFLAVTVNAQTTQPTKEVKKEMTNVKSDAKSDVKELKDDAKASAPSRSCCKKSTADCSKMTKKDCTAAEKAECEKKGMKCDHAHDHAKGETEKHKEMKSE